ncbi:N-acetylmuramoyl-L-alanine amidase [Fibrobacter sp.]|uniref:N-acetylmuramoyl-L-alanine amidase family protein n=1 Tax=Fibrobacter sp. TaxID=35828 RepID=UPI00388FD2B1
MKRLVAAIFACLVCATFAWGASNATSVNFLDAEILSKDAGASFHWFPIQKTFILVTAKDTAKFAVGISFVSHNSNVMELAASPKLENGHLWISRDDAYKLFPNAKPSSSSAAPVSSSVTQSSSSATLMSSSSAAPAPSAAAPAAVTTPASTIPAATPVAPPKNETAGTREVKTIVIDPGHGGKDTGAQGKKSNEKDIVLAIGKLLKKELEKEGFNVKMTRDKDVFIELGQRANLANQWDGDLFISLHCNAIDATAERKKQVKGYHVYVLRAPESEEDKAIARRENKVATLYGEKNAKEELSPIEWFKLEARLEKYKQNSYMFTEEMLKAMDGGKIRRQAGGVGGAGFMVLVGALMPAVLFEIGFISNPEDEAYMITDKGQKDIAVRISKAVSTYKAAVHSYRETLGR